MNWLQRYRIRAYLRDSIWVAPVLAIVAAILVVRVLSAVEGPLGWQQSTLNTETARAVLGTLAGAMFTFIVFMCSSLLLLLQLASAQLTPLVIGRLFRDPVTKLGLAAFVFMFTFVTATLLRVNSSVPPLIAEVSGYGCAACLGLLLYLIDHIGHMLRPNGIFRAVAAEAHRVIENVYPRRWNDPHSSAQLPPAVTEGAAHVVRSLDGGVVLAFDVPGILKLCARHDCVIDLVPQVGDYVAPRAPIFRVFGDACSIDAELQASIALGAERTMKQDPAYALRVIVDIASRALSPAMNDPTTAVLAIDQIHHVLAHLGNRRLDDERFRRDSTGRVRLLYRTPNWEDFVVLAVIEIRQFGASSIQVLRRLRAMLDDLIRTLPAERAAPLRQELTLITHSTERHFQEPEDRALAGISDPQGVGGSHDRTRTAVGDAASATGSQSPPIGPI